MENNIKEDTNMSCVPSSDDMRNYIHNTKEPLIVKNMLSWSVLNWTLDDWSETFEDEELEVRVGYKKCTKVPQWENNCDILRIPPKDVIKFSELDGNSNNRWMYFDYKQMKNCFRMKTDLLKSISWNDFGFPSKDGYDSTIWIGTTGAYTPCHMDSYGCNIIAQVFGRKLWILFPPNKTALLKPTRVPYEESSVYSKVQFSCGLNVSNELDQARIVELVPGDVLIIPKNWWHYVENLSTAISINMWIPLESDDESRLEESLVKFIVALALKTTDKKDKTSLINPNEMAILDETVDIRQISWCVDQCRNKKASELSKIDDLILGHHKDHVQIVPTFSAVELRNMLLKKCGCVNIECQNESKGMLPLTLEDIINAYCHPEIVTKVANILRQNK